MKKRITALFLAIALICSLLPAAVLTASAETYSGTCGGEGDGSNLMWTLDTDTGLLEITGTGAMKDYGPNEVPWGDYLSLIKSVIIDDGATTVGGYAFRDCDALTSVTIPDSVENIRYAAFENCIGLTNITIPDGVKILTEGAFAGCSGLTSITLPDSVTGIGPGAFASCTALTSITFSSGVQEIDYGAFYNCGALTDVYYNGTEAAWNTIKISNENECLTEANIHYMVVACQHEHAYPEHKDATCTEPGYDRMICDDCGEVISETGIPALGHDIVVDAEVAATCTATGLTAGEHCTRCDYRVAQEVVPMTAHTYKDGVCTVCGAKDPDYKPPVAENPFGDVEDTDYYYAPVLWAVENGVTKGTSATAFGPDDTCTRAQVVTFLWRAKGSPEPKSANNPFNDVKESEYYYKAVLWAVENNITAGTSATTFSPNAGCTRAQVVTFLWRAEGQPKPTSSANPFKDVTGGYFYDAVLWAVEKNITAGTSATTFSPDNTCTRGQIVTFLYRDMT